MISPKRKVAISQRVDLIAARGESRDALDQRLVRWVIAAGYLPVAVPNTLFVNGADDDQWIGEWLRVVQPDAVLLSGGNDIGACPDRDATEGYLLDWAYERHTPVLGICRGMQMLGHWSGCGMKRVEGHVRTCHSLTGSVVGEANSYHEFSLTACPPQFDVLARSEDGEIEAIRHKALPWEGWMWHPEREGEFCPRDLKRVQEVFS